jgi:1-acyl-sn-glycerol-3-phosphate acyltransferase
MGLLSSPIGLVGRGVGAVGQGIGGARANATAVAGDLIGRRASDPLEARDPDFIRATLPGNRQLANVLFRPKVRGLENVPSEGPVLLVGNHSGGTMIIDTFVFAFEFYRHFGPERRFHQLAHDVAVKLPGISALLRSYGTLPASHKYAARALEAGAAVLVYPGGDYESFRPSWHSEQVEFGGRRGFIELALSQDVPIVPVVSIGGQESALFVTRGERLARLLMLDRLLRIKVLPIAFGPPFGLSILDLPPRLPLPSQVTIEVRPPIDLRERFGPDPDRDEVYEEITSLMQDTLDDLAEERDLPLVGTVWSDRSGGEGAEDEGGEAEPDEADEGEDAEDRPGRPPPAASAAESDCEPAQSPWRAAGPGDEPQPLLGDDAAAGDEPEQEPVGPPVETAQPDVPPGGPRRDGAAPPAAIPEPTHVDAEATLVAEFAEAGAEDGAGAELRVEEPWEGYARLKVGQVAERLRDRSDEALLAVRLYETTHKGRRGVLQAVERELKRRR